MQRYPVRRDHLSGLGPARLEEIARASFGMANREADLVRVNFGALEELTARVSGKELEIGTRMNPKVPPETAAETVRRYNRFLEEATGYSSKERAKRLRKSVTGSSAGT